MGGGGGEGVSRVKKGRKIRMKEKEKGSAMHYLLSILEGDKHAGGLRI